MKLVGLIKMYLQEAFNEVFVGNFSDNFSIEYGLKQGDAIICR
jgi:hypothetical protein